MRMKKFENKTVFITGGLSGIGKACAMAAAKEGANIAIADMKPSGSNTTIEELKKENAPVIFLECDVSEFEMTGDAIKATVATFGKLDIALNNAGIGGEASKVGKMSEEAWLKVIGVNLNGVFNCMRHELEYMWKQKSGVIVNIASVMGKVGFSTSSHYVAAKHGVIGLTQTAALEYATDGIRINALCPGFIDTPLLTKVGINKDEDSKQRIINLHPMKRLGKPEEIAKAFVFLASDESSFISGTAMEIDGGYLAE
jgi:NAD(P)-dependent dehydrogenase (short-subunit alcohol dehydrogenase family)